MRKALLIVAMLLLVTPVMATTTITAVNEGVVQTPDNNYMATVRIDYTSTVDVRAFALDINIDNDGNRPNFQRIRNFKVGESNGASVGGSSGYGIFPSRFRDFIVVTGPNWVDTNYNPTTSYNEPGTVSPRAGMGYPQMIVEMGTLYLGDPNKPSQSGTLFRFDVNSWGASGTFKVTVAADALRGGVVGSDGNAITAAFVPATIIFPSGCINIPGILNDFMADANSAIAGAGLTGTIAITYANSNTVDYGKVISQDTGCVAANATIHYVASAGCFPMTDAAYSQWVSVGTPRCWCYPRQCHGDADGLAQGSAKAGFAYVGTNDLNIFVTAFNVFEPPKGPGIASIPNGICADFDHAAQGSSKAGFVRVGTNDLNVFVTYFNVFEPTKGTGTPADCGGTVNP